MVLAMLLATVACRECHAKQVDAFAASGMGRSFRPAAGMEASVQFRHKASGTRVRVHGDEHTVGSAREKLAYIVGSGAAGSSYLILRNGEWLYQSPVSFFAKRNAWDVSPGYEQNRSLDFSRPVPEECVFCHAGAANAVKGSVNRYAAPAAPVTGFPCERCHGGNGTDHATFVNPTRLPAAARDAVCEQCHLSGEARILHPGKTWSDLRPGQRLEDTVEVFVRKSAGPLRVVSHVEQLAASACARASSGKLWCGSCHQVHGGNRAANTACAECHPSVAHRQPVHADCAGCHMPKSPVEDAAHTAFTDHRIQRRPSSESSAPAAADELRAWSGTGTPRGLGLAYIQAGQLNQSDAMVQRGFAILAEHQRQYNNDPDVLGALGYVLMRKQRPAEAAALLTRAVALQPQSVLLQLNLGLAQAAAGRPTDARRTLEQLLERDPSVATARAALQAIR